MTEDLVGISGWSTNVFIPEIMQAFAKNLMRQQQQSGDASQISVHTDLDSSTASSRVGASRIWEMSDGWEEVQGDPCGRGIDYIHKITL